MQAQYHDGTTERSRLAQTSRRTFKLVQRLTAAALSALVRWLAHKAEHVPVHLSKAKAAGARALFALSLILLTNWNGSQPFGSPA
jgi:hypothetical protein